MERSESIALLAAALAEAQGEFKHAERNRNNPHLKSKYADLAAVIDATRPGLTAHGLAIVQTFEPSEPQTVAITTLLLHKSGEWLSGVTAFPVAQDTAQGFASSSTYARRYGWLAICGIASDDGDDDDGHAASRPETGQRDRQRPGGREPEPARQALRESVQPPPAESAGDRAATGGGAPKCSVCGFLLTRAQNEISIQNLGAALCPDHAREHQQRAAAPPAAPPVDNSSGLADASRLKRTRDRFYQVVRERWVDCGPEQNVALLAAIVTTIRRQEKPDAQVMRFEGSDKWPAETWEKLTALVQGVPVTQAAAFAHAAQNLLAGEGQTA